jgi:hypothetical protein
VTARRGSGIEKRAAFTSAASLSGGDNSVSRSQVILVAAEPRFSEDALVGRYTRSEAIADGVLIDATADQGVAVRVWDAASRESLATGRSLRGGGEAQSDRALSEKSAPRKYSFCALLSRVGHEG